MAYQDTIVSYVDVLGFRALVKASATDPATVNKITDILEATKRKGQYNWLMGTNDGIDERYEEMANVQTFSDLIVRTTIKRPGIALASHLHFELLTLARIQWELLELYQVLVRGGVCLKQMSSSDHLFGPGLVRAYELAEEIAVFPRIVIDGQLVQLAGNIDAPWWRAVLGRGEDGQYFIDYLNSLVRRNLPPNINEIVPTFMRHKDLILNELEKPTAKDEKIRQKIIWMSLYHNKTIERFCADHANTLQQLNGCRIDSQRIA